MPENILPAPNHLILAAQRESENFQKYYSWLENAMPAAFFKEVSADSLMLINHSLMGLALQDYFSTINLKNAAIVLCLDTPDADLRILENYALYGIKNYQTYVSKQPVPFPGMSLPLRIATIDFTESIEHIENPDAAELKEKLWATFNQEHPEIDRKEFDRLVER